MGLSFHKSCIDQMLASTATVNEHPSTGTKLNLDPSYILGGLAEKMHKLIGKALEKGWAVRRCGP
jgi:hypothetical protein